MKKKQFMREIINSNNQQLINLVMKKYFKFVYVSAIALLGAGVFTACSSDSGIVADDGNVSDKYNPATGEVNVDFVMNVSSGSGNTRQSAANTQASITDNFRGINNAILATFTQSNDGKWMTSAGTANKSYNMGEILGSGALDPDGTGNTPKSRRVIELALPTGTNTLMFWGTAIKNGTDKQQGSISYTVDKNMETTSFTLSRRIPESSEAAFTQYKNMIAAVMTKLVDSRQTVEGSYGGANYNVTLGWKDYVTYDNDNNKLVRKDFTPAVTGDVPLDPLGEIMADAFISLNTIYDAELRAGAGPAVARTLGDLYEVINSVATAVPTSKAEAITKDVASHWNAWLTTLVDPTSKQWTSTGNVKSFVGAGAYDLVTGDINNFPMTPFNVPQGATILQIAIENKTSDTDRSFSYSYKSTIPTYAMDGGSGGSFNPLNYRYPAELCYFGNSPVRVTNDAHVTADYPDGVANWDNDDSWAAGATGTGSAAWTKNGHVLSSTRSVAMQQNINYGTALLKTTVRYGAATLKDNNHQIQQERRNVDEPNNEITPGVGTFTLTGVLIGGVEETMGWNYLAKAVTPTFSSYIYDNDLPSTAIPAYTGGEGTKSVPNYTLVWDNWNQASKGSKQNVVYVALEFVNNSGRDFWGMNNLIRNGATFYITGKLDPDVATAAKLTELGKTAEEYLNDKSLGITWPTQYALPPYAADGSTIKERRVFIQDYMTEANFTIGEYSLQSALIAVPDLRSTQISLGLSVDLEWQGGLTFESTLGQ